MDIKPVKKYKTPRYPEKSVLLANPNLLKTVPERWKGNIYIGVALTSILAFSLVGCSLGNWGFRNSPSDKLKTKNSIIPWTMLFKGFPSALVSDGVEK